MPQYIFFEHVICVHDHLDSETFTENINQYVNNGTRGSTVAHSS